MASQTRFLSRFVSWRGRQPSTEEELEKLSQEIQKLTDEILNKQQTERVVVRKLLIFSSMGYSALAIFVYFYMLAAHHEDESGSATNKKGKSGKTIPYISSQASEPRAIWLIKLVVILISPLFFIFCIIRLLQWTFRWQVARSQTRIRECLRRKQQLLDNVRDTEPYNKAVHILSKYGERGSNLLTPGKAANLASAGPPASSLNKNIKLSSAQPNKPEDKGTSSSLRQRPKNAITKAQSLAEPNSSSGGNEPETTSSLYAGKDSGRFGRQPPPQTSSVLSLPSQPDRSQIPASPSLFSFFSRPSSSPSSAAGVPATTTPSLPQLPNRPATPKQVIPTSLTNNARPAQVPKIPVLPPPGKPHPQSPQKPTFLDRAVSWLVGEGTEYRFALICSRCFRHNGLALPEEFEYIGFKCCYCDETNYPRKQRPVPPSVDASVMPPGNWMPQPQIIAPLSRGANRFASGRYSMPALPDGSAAVRESLSKPDADNHADKKLAPIASVTECDEELYREEVFAPTSNPRRGSEVTSSGTVTENAESLGEEPLLLQTADSQSGILQPNNDDGEEKISDSTVLLDNPKISTSGSTSVDSVDTLSADSDEESEA